MPAGGAYGTSAAKTEQRYGVGPVMMAHTQDLSRSWPFVLTVFLECPKLAHTCASQSGWVPRVPPSCCPDPVPACSTHTMAYT